MSWRFVLGAAGITVLAVNAAWTVVAFVTLRATERVLSETEHLQSLLARPTPPPPPGAPHVPPPSGVPPERLGIAELDATHYLVDRGALRWMFAEARLAPERENGQVVGLRMSDVFPGSLLGRLGFQDGDRIDSLSGIPVDTPERTMAAYERLSRAADFYVVVRRGNARVTLMYTVL